MTDEQIKEVIDVTEELSARALAQYGTQFFYSRPSAGLFSHEQPQVYDIGAYSYHVLMGTFLNGLRKHNSATSHCVLVPPLGNTERAGGAA